MRDVVSVCAILGGVIELIAAIGGPQLAGVGIMSSDPAPAMPTGALIVGMAAALLSIVGGGFIQAGRSGQLWGVALIAAAVVGSVVVTSLTLWFTFGAFFTLLAGVLALFLRRRRGAAQ
jgi:hypothetical protein